MAAGPLLTRAQFAAWATKNNRPNASYSNYLSYVNNARTSRAVNKPAANPFGAQDAATLQRTATGLYGSPYSTAAMDTMASHDVHSLVDPVIAQLNSDYTNRANAGAQAIQSVTDQYAQRLGDYAPQMQTIFDSASNKIAALNDALGGAVNGGSTDSFSKSLGSLGLGGNFATNYAGLVGNAGKTLQGYGTDAASALVGTGAGYEGYAKLLPGFADLQGINNIGAFRTNLETERSGKVGDLLSQLPGMVSNALQNYQNISEQRRGNAAQFISQGLDRYQQAAQAAATLGLDTSKFVADQNQFYAGLDAQTKAKAQPMPWNTPAEEVKLESQILPQYITQAGPAGTTTKKDWASAYHDAAQAMKRLYPNAPANWIDHTLRQYLPTVGIQPKPGQGLPQKRPGQGTVGQRERDTRTANPAPTPKPAGHPQAIWMQDGPKGQGWYEPHLKYAKGSLGRIGTPPTVYVKVG